MYLKNSKIIVIKIGSSLLIDSKMKVRQKWLFEFAKDIKDLINQNKKINILDTPGHKDCAEDTCRTLTAVDSVIVVIDVAKGVEEQTEKLVEVCRMRNTPVIIFINKMDLEGQDPFDLLDELEEKLQSCLLV